MVLKDSISNPIKASGVLCHITSLATSYGVGDFGPVAYEFIDHLADSHQHYWQILPIGNTNDSGCPYATDSAFGCADFFVSPDLLGKEYNIVPQKFNVYFSSKERVDFKNISNNKRVILEAAFALFTPTPKYEAFLKDESSWIEAYGLFRTFSETRGQDWRKWPSYQNAQSELNEFEKQKFQFHLFAQFTCFSQLCELKKYANKRNIKLVGDLPLFVSYFSMDVWKNPDQFYLEKGTYNMVYETGAAPDGFFANGQKWGTPIYDWEYQKKANFEWWNERLSFLKRYFDVVRIDHFRGFSATWISEVTASDAANGKWYPGPGSELFKNLKNYPEIIAEDLGYITPDVEALRSDFGFLGMKVFQLMLGGDDNSHKLQNYNYNSAAYSGTHDCDTLMGWYKHLSPAEKETICKELDVSFPTHWDFLKILLRSPSKIVFIQVQDLLGLGSSARFNYPGTVQDLNWTWKLSFKETRHIDWARLGRLTLDSKRAVENVCG